MCNWTKDFVKDSIPKRKKYRLFCFLDYEMNYEAQINCNKNYGALFDIYMYIIYIYIYIYIYI